MLSVLQRHIVKSFLRFPLDDVMELQETAPDVVRHALDALLELYTSNGEQHDLYDQYQEEFKAHDIVESIDQLRRVAEHPAPQNRSETYPYQDYVRNPLPPNTVMYRNADNRLVTERQGLLGLSARHVPGEDPATRDDVLNFIAQQLRERQALLQQPPQEERSPSPPAQSPEEEEDGEEEALEPIERHTQFFARRPAALHRKLLRNLIADMDADPQQVCYGTVVEQAIMGLAGIYTDQTGGADQAGASFRALPNDRTRFVLHFANEGEMRTFYEYYNRHCPGLLVSEAKQLQGTQWEVIMDTDFVLNRLSLALGQFYRIRRSTNARLQGPTGDPVVLPGFRGSHMVLMQVLIDYLRVAARQVVYGDVVETTLVRMAGINANQSAAQFRLNDNYSTRFQLSLTERQAQIFRNYYNQRFPGLILNESRTGENDVVAVFDMNTRILETDVGYDLARFYRRSLRTRSDNTSVPQAFFPAPRRRRESELRPAGEVVIEVRGPEEALSDEQQPLAEEAEEAEAPAPSGPRPGGSGGNQ